CQQALRGMLASAVIKVAIEHLKSTISGEIKLHRNMRNDLENRNMRNCLDGGKNIQREIHGCFLKLKICKQMFQLPKDETSILSKLRLTMETPSMAIPKYLAMLALGLPN
uniref:Uncharacterized protein n=1 Tax=Aegilops tauschii subsp. strangulata TaxID=200361 RepID=A0A453AH18_AEGTS